MKINNIQEDYLNALVEGNRGLCFQIIHKAIAENTSIYDLYNEVFYPTMIKIGDLWQSNRFTVAQEHLATAITQNVMSTLYQHIFAQRDTALKGKILLTCPGNELHEMGARMMADLLELEGWNVLYLGANMPSFSVVEMMEKEKPSLVGISCTMSYNLKHVKELIEKIKTTDQDQVPIMVGGMVFNIDPEAKNFVGADYYAQDFNTTLKMMHEIIKKR